jgi:hypothetical protein
MTKTLPAVFLVGAVASSALLPWTSEASKGTAAAPLEGQNWDISRRGTRGPLVTEDDGQPISFTLPRRGERSELQQVSTAALNDNADSMRRGTR